MQAQIDKFGRLLIPKAIREHLGIKTGSIVQMIEHEHEILIKLFDQQSFLEKKSGILIYTGESTGDIESALHESREDRLKDLF